MDLIKFSLRNFFEILQSHGVASFVLITVYIIRYATHESAPQQ